MRLCVCQLTSWRVNTFFTKEPETLEWIDSFNAKDKTIFWDIGANVGFVEINSDKGHDSFLLDVPDFLNALKNFLDKSYK